MVYIQEHLSIVLLAFPCTANISVWVELRMTTRKTIPVGVEKFLFFFSFLLSFLFSIRQFNILFEIKSNVKNVKEIDMKYT